MIKGSFKKDITIVKIYSPNIEKPKYINQILTDVNGEIDNNTIVIGNFNILLTSMARSSRKSIRRQWS